MKKLFITFITLQIFILFYNNCFSQIIIKQERIEFIKRNFKIGENNAIENLNIRKILIGHWESAPHHMIEFKKNGKFVLTYYDGIHKIGIKKSGIWNLDKCILKMKLDNNITWYSYKIINIILSYDENNTFKYFLELIFDKQTFWGEYGIGISFD